jgi:putative ABC transport system substrate-binding protein
MNRRAFVTDLGAMLAAPLAAEAQQAGKVWRIGILFSLLPVEAMTNEHPLLKAFLKRMGELGYVHGRDLLLERRSAEGNWDRLPHLVADFVRVKVDVIVVAPGWLAAEAQKTTKTIPIVFVAGSDATMKAAVASLAQPGGNVTGISELTEELTAKRLELLKATIPTAESIAFLFNPTVSQMAAPQLTETEAACRRLGLKLQVIEARSPSDFGSAFLLMKRVRAGAIFVAADPVFYTNRVQIAELASKNQLPTMFEWREASEAGALMSYGPSLPDAFRRAATYVDKILRGTRPGDLPVEQATKFELVINLKTAKALGLTIPPSLLLRADQVIE